MRISKKMFKKELNEEKYLMNMIETKIGIT